MMSNQELNTVVGGGGGYIGILAVLAGAVSFVIGFLDGLTRPYKCR